MGDHNNGEEGRLSMGQEAGKISFGRDQHWHEDSKCLFLLLSVGRICFGKTMGVCDESYTQQLSARLIFSLNLSQQGNSAHVSQFSRQTTSRFLTISGSCCKLVITDRQTTMTSETQLSYPHTRDSQNFEQNCSQNS